MGSVSTAACCQRKAIPCIVVATKTAQAGIGDHVEDLKEKWQEWELRYEHNRDFQAAQCASIGVPIPVEKEYGVLKLVKGIWRKVSGPKFWPLFSGRGHNSCVFEGCKCKKKWGTTKE